MILYHNPRCSKSRQALALLEENGAKFEIKDYLKEGLKTSEVQDLIKATGVDPLEGFVRTKEAVFKELGLNGKELSNAQWAKTVAENPKLLERPILVKGKKAVIGRPPENVLDLV